MEPQPSRKRPWEDDDPTGLPYKRRESILATPTPSIPRQTSPLPHEAGYYSRDSQVLNQRRLPPLYTSSCDTSAELTTYQSAQDPVRARHSSLLYSPRPRSQSLFNVFRHPHWQEDEHYRGMDKIRSTSLLPRQLEARFASKLACETHCLIKTNRSILPFLDVVFGADSLIDHPIDYHRTLESDTSHPALRTEVHRPQSGIGPAPHAAGASSCCLPTCQGQECLTVRTLTRKLAAELALLDSKVKTVTRTEHHSSDQVSYPSE
jgi:hypothetical protein